MRRDLSHFLIAYSLAMGRRPDPRAPPALRARRRPHGLLRLLRLGDDARGGRPGRRHQAALLPPAPGDAAPAPHLRQIGVAILGIIVGAEIFVREVSGAERDARRAPLSWSRCSSRRSPRSCRRSSTRCSGSGRARTRWRSATSPVRWCSSPPSRCRWASLFATWQLNATGAGQRRARAGQRHGLLPHAADQAHPHVVVAGRRRVRVLRLSRLRVGFAK